MGPFHPVMGLFTPVNPTIGWGGFGGFRAGSAAMALRGFVDRYKSETRLEMKNT